MEQDNMKTRDNVILEEKVHIIAEEVMDILKQISQDNKKQLDTNLIAERMFIRDTVKKLLSDPAQEEQEPSTGSDDFRAVANALIDSFPQCVPSSITDNLIGSPGETPDNNALKNSPELLGSSIKVIKKYFDSISARNKELEEFLQQTMQYLGETETYISSEALTYQEQFNNNREFESDLSSNMNMIGNEFNISGDLNIIKTAVLNKIENIKKGIAIKREQDMQRLRNVEQTLDDMKQRMTDIKKEAGEIKKRSLELERDSLFDKLTGLYNRKAFDNKMSEAFANMSRYKTPYSVMFCDIDNFKGINDKFGHKVGDAALKNIASLLKEKLRKNDFISRYGGEEFVIILPHTVLEDAKIAGEGVRSFIDSAVFSYKGSNIPLTLSIGICEFGHSDDCNTVIERADRALYLAKKSGKNTIRSEDDL